MPSDATDPSPNRTPDHDPGRQPEPGDEPGHEPVREPADRDVDIVSLPPDSPGRGVPVSNPETEPRQF